MKKLLTVIICMATLTILLSACNSSQTDIFEMVIPVERVEITNNVSDHNDTWGDYVVLTGSNQYQIEYTVYPSDATNSVVQFSFAASPDGCATVDENGLVTFSGEGMIKVFVCATDGTDAMDTLTIINTNSGK